MKEFKRSIVFLAIVFTLLFIVYRIQFNGSLSTLSSDWANFTTYLFGIITPLISLFGFYFIMLTLKNTDKHNLIIHYSNTLNQIDGQIDRILNKEIYISFTGSNKITKTLRSALRYNKNVKEQISIISDSRGMNQINSQAIELKKLRYFLIEMSKITNEILKIDRNNKMWTNIYRIKYQEVYNQLTNNDSFYFADKLHELDNKENSVYALTEDEKILFDYFKT